MFTKFRARGHTYAVSFTILYPQVQKPLFNISHRGVCRNLSRKDQQICFYKGGGARAWHPLGPKDIVEIIDFTDPRGNYSPAIAPPPLMNAPLLYHINHITYNICKTGSIYSQARN